MQKDLEPKLNSALLEIVELIKKDLTERLDNQIGVDGQAMPKKKQPQRSLDPTHFLRNTGQSWKLHHRIVGFGKAVISVARPQILTLPAPSVGLAIWWGVPIKIQEQALNIVKKWINK